MHRQGSCRFRIYRRPEKGRFAEQTEGFRYRNDTNIEPYLVIDRFEAACGMGLHFGITGTIQVRIQ